MNTIRNYVTFVESRNTEKTVTCIRMYINLIEKHDWYFVIFKESSVCSGNRISENFWLICVQDHFKSSNEKREVWKETQWKTTRMLTNFNIKFSLQYISNVHEKQYKKMQRCSPTSSKFISETIKCTGFKFIIHCINIHYSKLDLFNYFTGQTIWNSLWKTRNSFKIIDQYSITYR